MNIRFSILIGIIVLAALSRLIPHPFNFTPITAIALFGGAYFTNRMQAILVPMAAMLLSDTILEVLIAGSGFHSGMMPVYAAFALVSVTGVVLLKDISPLRLILTSLLSSFIFFLVTNLVFFYPESSFIEQNLGKYPHNFTGIIASYTAGLPFLRNQILGDLFFSGILFGSFHFLQRKLKALKVA